MKTKTKSKQSSSRPSRKRPTLGETLDVVIPTEFEDLKKLEINKVYERTVNGVTFNVARSGIDGATCYVGGKKLKYSRYYGFVDKASMSVPVSGPTTGDQSCAYARLRPRARDDEEVAALDWLVNNIPFERGCTCYVTKNDGKTTEILRILKKRGFRCVAVNKSIHAGNYPVYLLVHPGDPFYSKKTTTKVDLFPHVDEQDTANAA